MDFFLQPFKQPFRAGTQLPNSGRFDFRRGRVAPLSALNLPLRRTI